MKKLLLMLLGMLLVFPIMVRDFEYTYEGQTLTYTVISEDDMTCMTKEGVDWSSGNNVSGDLIIPAVAIDGETEYQVTAIGNKGFYGCSDLLSVTLPNSIINIEDYAFDGCGNLTSITIPNSVTKIGARAFFGCI